MIYKIHNKSSKNKMNNSSCSALVNYLEKEVKNNWFSDDENELKRDFVLSEIDKNGKGQLSKKDWKFCEIEICPSFAEQQEIIKKATGKEVNDWNELDPLEQDIAIDEFKNYIRKVQDDQAVNYGRSNIKNGGDLLYFAKIETKREVRGFDFDKKYGKKQGEEKPGLNLHCHIVQSRKGKDKKTKLSPLSPNKEASEKNKIKQGFNRNDFANKIEQSFDLMYQNDRKIENSFEYLKAKKLGRDFGGEDMNQILINQMRMAFQMKYNREISDEIWDILNLKKEDRNKILIERLLKNETPMVRSLENDLQIQAFTEMINENPDLVQKFKAEMGIEKEEEKNLRFRR